MKSNNMIWAMLIMGTLVMSTAHACSSTDTSRDRLIEAIIQVESKGDPNAIGDGGKAVGILQIHKIMVDDVNRILGSTKYSYEDRRDPAKSREMFRVYTDHYTPEWDAETVARRWNAGPKGDKKDCSIPYWKKVKKCLDAE